jgi:hypothetical protein
MADFPGVAVNERILSWPARRWLALRLRSGSGSASLGSGSAMFTNPSIRARVQVW